MEKIVKSDDSIINESDNVAIALGDIPKQMIGNLSNGLPLNLIMDIGYGHKILLH